MKYLFELHCHTEQSSSCAKIPAEEVVKLYLQEGYSGIIITDHLSSATIKKCPNSSFAQLVDYQARGYFAAREAAALLSEDFSVFYGVELNSQNEGRNDYLLYGITPEMLKANEWLLYNAEPELLSRFCRDNGILLVQAHPFRNHMTLVPPLLLDGIECYNGNARHDSRNEIASEWADRFGLIKTSGSDFHELSDLARGGAYLSQRPKDILSLTDILKSGDYSLKKTQ